MTDRYFKELFESDPLQELESCPNRNDYESQSEWMEAIETWRNQLLTPPTNETPLIIKPS